jgi:hypothetical protein
VKGFPSFNPLAFAHVPADITASKMCEDAIFGNSDWHCVYKICGFIWVKKLATFCYVGGASLPEKFDFIFLEFKIGQPAKVKPFRCPTVTSEKALEVSPRKVSDRTEDGTMWEERGVQR